MCGINRGDTQNTLRKGSIKIRANADEEEEEEYQLNRCSVIPTTTKSCSAPHRTVPP
jgi:hypothetical protein